MKRYPRKDANHADIVNALRKFGWSVLDLAAMGSGCPDLLIGRRGKTQLAEIKDGSKPPSARQLTDDQIEFIAGWPDDVLILQSVDDVLAISK